MQPTPKCRRCSRPLISQRSCDCPPSWATTPRQMGLWRAVEEHRAALRALAAVDYITCPAVRDAGLQIQAHVERLEEQLFDGDPVPEHTCPGPMTKPCTCGLSEAMAKRVRRGEP